MEQTEAEQAWRLAFRRACGSRKLCDTVFRSLEAAEDMPAAGIGDVAGHQHESVGLDAAAAYRRRRVTANAAMRVEALADPVALVPGARELAQPVPEDFALDFAGFGPRLAKG